MHLRHVYIFHIHNEVQNDASNHLHFHDTVKLTHRKYDNSIDVFDLICKFSQFTMLACSIVKYHLLQLNAFFLRNSFQDWQNNILYV